MHIVDQIFEAFGGGPKRIADATGIAIQTVCDWRIKGRKEIPHWRRSAVFAAAQSEGVSLSAEATEYLNSAKPADLAA